LVVKNVHGQVEDGHFQLVRVHDGVGGLFAQVQGHANGSAHGNGDQFLHARDQRVHIRQLGQQRLPARECQQLARELGAASGRQLGLERDGAGLFLFGAPGDELQVHAHHVQQVVEVVSDPAGQAADRFHLLRLRKRGLRAFAFRYFLHQAVIRARQLARARGNAPFQLAVQPLDR
jgi:hypothetical protein